MYNVLEVTTTGEEHTLDRRWTIRGDLDTLDTANPPRSRFGAASLALRGPVVLTSRPVPAEMRYVGWTEISGVRFPTHRVNYHSGVKRGEVTTEAIHVNVGLRPQELAATPADFSPDIPRR
jgi:hypothetical protein